MITPASRVLYGSMSFSRTVPQQNVLTMMSLIGYLTYYLAYRKAKSD